MLFSLIAPARFPQSASLNTSLDAPPPNFLSTRPITLVPTSTNILSTSQN